MNIGDVTHGFIIIVDFIVPLLRQQKKVKKLNFWLSKEWPNEYYINVFIFSISHLFFNNFLKMNDRGADRCALLALGGR